MQVSLSPRFSWRRSLALVLANLGRWLMILVLALGLGGCGLLPQGALRQVLKNTTDQAPVSTLFVPRQAPALLTLQVNPDRLEPPSLLANVVGTPPLAEGLIQLKQGILDALGLTYETDIQPWLGSEITLALTDFDFDKRGDNRQQPGYLLALGVRDGQQARQFLHRFWQTRAVAGTSLGLETYKGANLIYDRPRPHTTQPTLASALVGDYFLLFANDPQVLRSALTTAQVPELSLALSDAYQRALQQFSDPRLGLGVLNLDTLWLGLHQHPLTQAVAETIVTPPPSSLLVSLSPTPYGLKADFGLTSSQPSPLTQNFPLLSNPRLPILHLLPPDTLALATGEELGQLFGELSTLAAQATWFDTALRPWFDRLNQTQDGNPSLLQRFLAGFQGNYLLALLPSPDTDNPLADPDWMVAVDRSPFGAPETLASLDRLAADQGYEVTTLAFQDHAITTWSQLQARSHPEKTAQVEAQLGGVHTNIESYEVFTSSLASLDRILEAQAGVSLGDTDAFQTLISPIAAAGYNYLYLNWPQSHRWLEAQWPSLPLLEFVGYSLFQPLDSVILRSDPPQDSVQRGSLALSLRSSNPPR